MVIKTVLAPNAPWPKYEEAPVPKPAPIVKKSPTPNLKGKSKIAHTNKKFDEWAVKNGAKK